MDKGRAWCPRAGCETICSINGNSGSGSPLGPVHCPNCSTDFCSICREPWHNGPCSDLSLGIPFGSDHIKCCPMCSVPIEKDEGCAQMMCKRCKHVFCWYCLASLDVSIRSGKRSMRLKRFKLCDTVPSYTRMLGIRRKLIFKLLMRRMTFCCDTTTRDHVRINWDIHVRP